MKKPSLYDEIANTIDRVGALNLGLCMVQSDARDSLQTLVDNQLQCIIRLASDIEAVLGEIIERYESEHSELFANVAPHPGSSLREAAAVPRIINVGKRTFLGFEDENGCASVEIEDASALSFVMRWVAKRDAALTERQGRT